MSHGAKDAAMLRKKWPGSPDCKVGVGVDDLPLGKHMPMEERRGAVPKLLSLRKLPHCIEQMRLHPHEPTDAPVLPTLVP